MIFTTSWDDGYKADLRIADLLDAHGAKGTFYACPQEQHGKIMLTKEEMLRLGARHEIGAHTMTHPRLSRIALAQAEEEINQSRRWVESMVGKECRMFCYPFGDHNDAVVEAVKAAGFIGARTVDKHEFSATDVFRMPTSIQLYPFPWRGRFARWWHPLDPLGPVRANWQDLNRLKIPLRERTSWLRYAKACFSGALERSEPFFHLWGHASEIDRFDLWQALEEFLGFVSSHKVEHVTNGELAMQSKRA